MARDAPVDRAVKAVSEATDPSKTSEDWALILDICDRFNELTDADALSTAADQVRNGLESTNQQTQFLSVVLIGSLLQNTSDKVKAVLCTSRFFNVLKALGTSSSTSAKVKTELLNQLDNLEGDLRSNTRMSLLRPLAAQIRQHDQSQRATVDDEEEQISRAIAESLREASISNSNGTPSLDPNTEVQMLSESNRRYSATSDAQSDRASVFSSSMQVRAIYDYNATEQGELSFRTGDVIRVLKQQYEEWWEGDLNGERGLFPANYVERIAQAPPQALSNQHTGHSSHHTTRSDANSVFDSRSQATVPDDDETYILAQARNVEKLLSIFAAASQHPGYSIVSNDDVQQMYNEVMALRPKLIQLIDEHAERKKRLLELNDQVSKARQTYENLVAARVASSTAAPYGTVSQLPRASAPTPSQTSMPYQARVDESGYTLTETPTAPSNHPRPMPQVEQVQHGPPQYYHLSESQPAQPVTQQQWTPSESASAQSTPSYNYAPPQANTAYGEPRYSQDSGSAPSAYSVNAPSQPEPYNYGQR